MNTFQSIEILLAPPEKQGYGTADEIAEHFKGPLSEADSKVRFTPKPLGIVMLDGTAMASTTASRYLDNRLELYEEHQRALSNYTDKKRPKNFRYVESSGEFFIEAGTLRSPKAPVTHRLYSDVLSIDSHTPRATEDLLLDLQKELADTLGVEQKGTLSAPRLSYGRLDRVDRRNLTVLQDALSLLDGPLVTLGNLAIVSVYSKFRP